MGEEVGEAPLPSIKAPPSLQLQEEEAAQQRAQAAMLGPQEAQQLLGSQQEPTLEEEGGLRAQLALQALGRPVHGLQQRLALPGSLPLWAATEGGGACVPVAIRLCQEALAGALGVSVMRASTMMEQEAGQGTLEEEEGAVAASALLQGAEEAAAM